VKNKRRRKPAKLSNVRKYWRKRVAKLEATIQRDRASHKAAMEARLVEVRSDPAVPPGTFFILAP